MKKITYKGQSKILIALCNLVNELVDTVDSAGDGDMKKSVYDTDGNGIVDNAEKVNNHTVNANVPENAVFTDTTYTFSQSGSQLTLTDDDGNAQSVNVPSTDTNTTYTMSLDGSKLTLTDSDGKTQDVTLPSGGSGGGTGMDLTLLKTVTGTTEVSLADIDYDELYIDVKIKYSDTLNGHFNTVVHKTDITDTIEFYNLTGGYSSEDYGYNVVVNISTSAIALRYCWIDKKNIKDSAVMSVYYGKKNSNELKITSDTWTPTNEYINSDRLYKRYFEKDFIPNTLTHRGNWFLIDSYSNLGINGNTKYINFNGTISTTDTNNVFTPLRAGEGVTFFTEFDTSLNGFTIVIDNSAYKTLKFIVKGIMETVESNLVTS